jgi:hypothetical protein
MFYVSPVLTKIKLDMYQLKITFMTSVEVKIVSLRGVNNHKRICSKSQVKIDKSGGKSPLSTPLGCLYS